MALIILMGPKHSGKTSAGRELARRMELPFFDLDALIEERTGKSPRELYRIGLSGEAGLKLFWREEETALEALLQKYAFTDKHYAAVLAAGGGIIDNPGAMALLKKEPREHCTVFLELSAGTAWQRIVNQGELPPFLEAESPEASKEKHRALHKKRNGQYKQFASLSIDAEEKTPARLAEELYNLILFNSQ